MRQSYVVTYDIADPKRLRAVFKLMRGYGDHLQLSVFYCELNLRERVQLQDRLEQILKPSADQVLFLNLGPAAGRGPRAISSLGRAFIAPQRHAIIV